MNSRGDPILYWYARLFHACVQAERVRFYSWKVQVTKRGAAGRSKHPIGRRGFVRLHGPSATGASQLCEATRVPGLSNQLG